MLVIAFCSVVQFELKELKRRQEEEERRRQEEIVKHSPPPQQQPSIDRPDSGEKSETTSIKSGSKSQPLRNDDSLCNSFFQDLTCGVNSVKCRLLNLAIFVLQVKCRLLLYLTLQWGKCRFVLLD